MLSEIKAAEESAPVKAPAEAAPEAAAPETAEGSADAGKEETGGEQPAPKMVPLAALHEERQTRKQIQADLRSLREEQQRQAQAQAERDQQYQIAQQRLQQMLEAQTRIPAPNKDADPLGYTAHMAEQTASQVAAMRQQEAERQQREYAERQKWEAQQQREQQVAAVVNTVQNAERTFAAKQPDYLEAVNFAKGQRAKELRLLGYDEQQAAQYLQNEGMQLAWTWLSQGHNPAERAYELAKTMGYRPAEPVDQAEVEKMHEQGQRTAKPHGGATPRARVTAQQLAAMSPAQLASLSEADFRAAMGG